jgi:hypothetical protein
MTASVWRIPEFEGDCGTGEVVIAGGSLTYGVQWSTNKQMHTVVETMSYLAAANALLDAEGMAAIVGMVAANPEIGEVMRGTGGFRKFRAARPGMGKRGGVRVIYIYRDEKFPVFLVRVYAKNIKESLTMAERNALKRAADAIFENYGVKP